MSLSRRGVLAAGGAVGALAATAAGTGSRRPRPRTATAPDAAGCARLRPAGGDGYRMLRGQKVGIVTKPTGITADVRHIVDVMHPDPGWS